MNVMIVAPVLLLAAVWVPAVPGFAATTTATRQLAITPPMGWNDWAHYQCNYTAQDILANARALVKTGLAARGYDTVTIDDCWMQKDRDASGNLQADPQRFPQGIKPIAQAVHALGLKFGIYEDAGYLTCGKFAGSGVPDGGGKDHFAAGCAAVCVVGRGLPEAGWLQPLCAQGRQHGGGLPQSLCGAERGVEDRESAYCFFGVGSGIFSGHS